MYKDNAGFSEPKSDKVVDYQKSPNEMAGEMMGKTNSYMARNDKSMAKAASKVKSQAHKGRYD